MPRPFLCLAALFQFFQRLFEGCGTVAHIGRNVAQNDLPVRYGIFLVAHGCVAACQSQVGPEFFFRMLRGMMSDIEEKLKPFDFIRVHRSVVVNMSVLKDVQPLPSGDYLLRTLVGRDFHVTRKYKSNLSQLVALTVGTPKVAF